jgi:hypothetical protein
LNEHGGIGTPKFLPTKIVSDQNSGPKGMIWELNPIYKVDIYKDWKLSNVISIGKGGE